MQGRLESPIGPNIFNSRSRFKAGFGASEESLILSSAPALPHVASVESERHQVLPWFISAHLSKEAVPLMRVCHCGAELIC